MKLQLYSTSHCHLCEQAESLLQQLTNSHHLTWQTLEIADDSALLTLYEIKIPVIKRLDTQAEIAWPFTAEQLLTFLA